MLIDEPKLIRVDIKDDQREEYHAWHCSFEHGFCGMAKSKTMQTTSGGFGNNRGPTGKSAKGTGNLHSIFSFSSCLEIFVLYFSYSLDKHAYSHLAADGYSGAKATLYMRMLSGCTQVVEFHYWLWGWISEGTLKIETWRGRNERTYSPRQTHFIAVAPQSSSQLN